MFKTTDNFTVNIKRKFNKIQKVLNIISILCVIIALIYFFYNGIIFATGDTMVLDLTRGYFDPIAKWFDPYADIKDLYIDTSKRFFLLAILFFVIGLILDKIKISILKTHEKIEEIKSENVKREEKRKKALYFDKYKHFSVAVSFDYKKYGQDVSIKAQNQLNKFIYQKMSEKLASKKNKIICSGIFILVSIYFNEYDNLFRNIFDTIQEIRKYINDKYEIDVIPTITVDAHNKQPEKDYITKVHFIIKGCNLKNKVINTDNFYKKYEFLGFKKFLGASIGLYDGNFSENNDYATYEVYQVVRNITDDMDGFI